MEGFLFGVYQAFGLTFFVVLSAVLLYHRLFRRWLRFAPAFFGAYGLGGLVFFSRWPAPFPGAGVFEALPYFLFFFGTLAAVGYCFLAPLSHWQSVGLLACYFAVLLAFLFLTGVDIGLPGKGSVEAILTSLPYIMFFAATPIVLGFCLFQGFGIRETSGVLLIFGFALTLLLVVTSTYFEQPFGFAPQLSAFTRAWIEIGSLLIPAVGLPLLVGGALLSSLTLRQTLGAIISFLAVALAIFVLVYLTIGYEFLRHALTPH